MSAKQKNDWSRISNVVTHGYIDEVKDAYANSALAICPILSGAGTNIKVIEAGTHRRNCVLTETASRGLTQDSNLKNSLIISSNAEAMANNIVELLNDQEVNQRSADVFQKAVQKKYSYEGFSDQIERTINTLIKTRI